MFIRLIFICVILFFIELYAFQAIKTLVRNKAVLWTYVAISAVLFVYILYHLSKFDRKVGQTHDSMTTMGLFLIVFVPKMLIGFVLFGEDLYRMVMGGVNFFVDYSDRDTFLPERRRFVSQAALGLAAIPLGSLIYGIFKGKYNYKVIRTEIGFPDLPPAFDGLRILQISDVHSGSFDDPEKIEYAIDLINQQEADIFLFTGDIVNTFATEMHPWLETFKKIKEYPLGKFAVLGNHDYGEYLDWDSVDAKAKNFEDIKQLYGEMGCKLLLNEHVFVNRGDDKIAVVGVENWGKQFKKAGDLALAAKGLTAADFKILMSHDPSHWQYQVKDSAQHFQLTLSGHTHGMQFGIEIPGWIKWSPVQFVYKQWAGLYEHLGRYVYVNRGFGFHAYPGRVGIWPEISVITLRSAKR